MMKDKCQKICLLFGKVLLIVVFFLLSGSESEASDKKHTLIKGIEENWDSSGSFIVSIGEETAIREDSGDPLDKCWYTYPPMSLYARYHSPYKVIAVSEKMYLQTECDVRIGPGNSYAVIGKAPVNQFFKVTGRVGKSWYRVKYNGQTGWVPYSSLGYYEKFVPVDYIEPGKNRWEYTVNELIQIALNDCIKPGMSVREKAIAVNNYLCRIVDYDYSYSRYSTFDALGYGSAVCQGYANAFMRIMEAAGVTTDYISGQGWTGTEWGSHGWNRIQIDGVYYYIDVTWNDVTNNKYLLMDYDTFHYDHYQQHVNYKYRIY